MDKNINGSEKVGRLTNLLSTIVARADVARRAGITFGDKRDLYKELGYSRVLTYIDFWERYQRGGIAARIVDAFPTATWRNPPIIEVKDDEDFNKTWAELTRRLSIYHYMERVDRLAGVGRYAVLFLGLAGGRPMDQAAQKVKDAEGLLFLSVFSEPNADVHALVDDTKDPRFGLPGRYNISFLSGKGIDDRTFKKLVHSSRVIHVADGVLEPGVT